MNKMRSSLNREGSEVESEDKISILSDTHFTSSVSWAGEMAQPLEAMLTSKPNPMAQEWWLFTTFSEHWDEMDFVLLHKNHP